MKTFVFSVALLPDNYHYRVEGNGLKMDRNISNNNIFKQILSFLLFIIFYILSAQFSLSVSAFFIPAGLAIGFLIVYGTRFLSAILIAQALVGFFNQYNLSQIIVTCLSYLMEAYIGHYLFYSFKNILREKFEFQQNLAKVLLISIISPVLSTFLSTSFLYLHKDISEASYYSTMFNWYARDVLGIMLFLPAIIFYKKSKPDYLTWLAPIISAFILVFFFYFDLSGYIFLLFLTTLIPVYFFRSVQGMRYTVIAVSLILSWFQLEEWGPFTKGMVNENIFSLQYFLLGLALTALSIDGFIKTGLIKHVILPLLTFWLITGSVYYYYHLQKMTVDEKVKAEITQDFEKILLEQTKQYENAIRGTAGFVSSSELVNASEWSEFARSLSIIDSDHGVIALNLEYISSKNKDQKKSLIYPANTLDDLKLVENKELALVFERANRLNSPQLSPSLEIKSKRVSFFIMPVKKNEKLVAWIIAPINIVGLFESLVSRRFDIEIYEGDNISFNKKIFSLILDPKLKRKSKTKNDWLKTINISGHPVTIDWYHARRYTSTPNSQNSLFVLLGAIFSVVAAGFILNLKLLNLKAQKLADDKNLKLIESQELFKSLFENSNDSVIVFNSEKIIDCNPFSLKMFEMISKKSLLSTPLSSLFDFADIETGENVYFFDNKLKELKFEKHLKFECIVKKNRNPFFAEVHMLYIQINDNPIYQAVIRDISERKKTEQNLVRSKELAEEAARAKSHFLSTMSHEIRTPLNGVVGMVNIILEEHPNLDFKNDLETIKYSADNLLHIVNEVLDYNKLESGKIILDQKVFNPEKLCENVFRIHQAKAQAKNLEFTYQFDSRIPKFVIGDEFKNGQILNNLISNAIKFTEKGLVKLEFRLKQIKNNQCTIEFCVIDTGIGIRNDKMSEIFNDFTQAESDHSRKYGGTGLGLAITKKLVEMQKGKISVSSSPEHGATFTYYVNFELSEEYPHKMEKNMLATKEEFKNQNVLLVEDNQVNIIVTKKYLIKWGLSVDVAVNGLEAVKMAQSHQYSLILMDLHMPLMDGFEATLKIREFNKVTPIIGLSADVMTESLQSLQKIGMDDFVTKPFKPVDFFSKLKSFLT